eukprot:CAMPEP_0201519202 /NCGR_PEP_ID=MMETSP0161_2-20130828/9803_1 /ASSEMBLY_ACC=CAM_ASM_000251 /TAXON_ID=180227 /ORGANISM="Neoparamoeba aestuarina, Strain SoJaBio B1-5/56/2" /LENGTH=394 /DNA_ID=CAMNT_0047917163 /DNA_START=71 /DNA_END=1252 /DNA_ORIENTATION=-
MLGWIWGSSKPTIGSQTLVGRAYQSSGVAGWKEVFLHGATLSIVPSGSNPSHFALKVSAGEDQKFLLNDDEDDEMVCMLGSHSDVRRESPTSQRGWFDPEEEMGISWGKEERGGGGRLMFVCEKETDGGVFDAFMGELARGVWRSIHEVEGTMEEEEGVKDTLRGFGEKGEKGKEKVGETKVKVEPVGGKGKEKEGKGKEPEEKNAFVMLDEIGEPPKGYCLEVRAHLHERVKKDGADFYRLLYKDCGTGLINISSEEGYFAYSFYVRRGPVVTEEDKKKNTLFDVGVHDHLQPQFSIKDLTFKFYLSGTTIEEFRLQFTNKDAFKIFRDGFIAFHWESSFQSPFNRLSKADRTDILSEDNHNAVDDYDLDDLEGVLADLALEDDFEEEEEEEE